MIVTLTRYPPANTFAISGKAAAFEASIHQHLFNTFTQQ